MANLQKFQPFLKHPTQESYQQSAPLPQRGKVEEEKFFEKFWFFVLHSTDYFVYLCIVKQIQNTK